MTPPRGAAAAGLAALAGGVQALSLAWPAGGQPLWWLQLLCLAVLIALLATQARGRTAFFVAWAYATSWLASTFWWLFVSMHFYGGLPAPLAVLAVLGLAAFLGLYYAAAGLVYFLLRTGRPGHDALLFASAWLVAELLRGNWFTGFPWGAVGYSHVEGPLAGFAPWVGVYGVGFAAAAVSAFLASLRRPNACAARSSLAAFGIVALGLGLGADAPAGTSAAGTPLRVALLQGNIPQDEKFEGGTGIPVALAWYAEQLRTAPASLVVTPETAIPLLPHQLPEGYLATVQGFFSDGRRAALAGIPLGNFTDGYTNSMLGWKAGATTYRYDKHHLVPFGEFIPPLFKWFTRMMNIPLGDFARGDVGQASFGWQGQRLAPNVCYEDLFGEELGARFADAATAPTIFVNVSNIGWFGDTLAIDQHLQASRMRALEFARPMIRATNTGATAIIDRFGRVTHQLPRMTRGVLVGDVEGGAGLTPFAVWVSHAGLWPLWLLGIGVPALLAGLRRRRRAPYNGRFVEPPSSP